MGGVVAPALVRVPHLYHFTNVNNLPGIRRLGGIFSTVRLNEMGEVFCAGGDEASLVLDRQCGMDQFVHLCFTAGHPMAFRVRERNPNANLTYLRIDRAILSCLSWKWRERSFVKITERTYEKRAQALHR
jgi:hypothetical protein